MKQYFAFQWHITDECDQRCKHCYTGKQARTNRVVVTVTYFVPCGDENSFSFGIRGLYKTVPGVCWRVDLVGQTITVGESTIKLNSVAGIESADGVFEAEWEIEAP